MVGMLMWRKCGIVPFRTYFRFRHHSVLRAIFGDNISNFVTKITSKRTAASEIEEKTQAAQTLAAVKRSLFLSSQKVRKFKDISTWSESDFGNLSDEQLLELAKYQNARRPENDSLAFLAWQEASKRGIQEGTYTYAQYLLNGIGVEKDEAKAFEILLSLANSHKNAFAHYDVGVLYDQGRGTAMDKEKAFQHYEISANLGIPPAATNLGNMYATGVGCEKNLEKAFNCFAIGAAGNEKQAKYFYALYLCQGIGCEKNLPLGLSIFKELALFGHTRAAHNLGCYYRDGTEVTQDIPAAINWYLIGAKGGYSGSSICLADLYFEGVLVPRDLKKADFYCDIAIKQNPNEPTFRENMRIIRSAIESEAEKK